MTSTNRIFHLYQKQQALISTIASHLCWLEEFPVINMKAFFKKLILQAISKTTSKCRIKDVASVSSRQFNEIFYYNSYFKERLLIFDNTEFSPCSYTVNYSIRFSFLRYKGSHKQQMSVSHKHLCSLHLAF